MNRGFVEDENAEKFIKTKSLDEADKLDQELNKFEEEMYIPRMIKNYRNRKMFWKNYISPLTNGLKIGILFGCCLGFFHGVLMFKRKSYNVLIFPSAMIVYSVIFGVGNTIFYLIRI